MAHAEEQHSIGKPRARPAAKSGAEARDLGEGRRLFAELVGTFMLTLVAAGGEVIGAISHDVGREARVVAPGLVVLALIYAVSNVSGAHFNPAVTLAFALRGVFPWRRVPGYWIAQLAGAVLAALVLRVLFGPVRALGTTLPHSSAGVALAVEILLTTLLVLVILGTASRNARIGPNAALAVGSTIALCGLFAGPISGASMNPARTLGPALVAGELGQTWIYILGPAIGALLATLCTWIMQGEQKPEEEQAATGDGAQ
jgi:aquaporin Z